MKPAAPARTAAARRAAALRFVLLLGVVSLLADLTYEGARAITGPYLAALGASATVVGVVAGLGEFVGYGLRLLAGLVSDRTGRYWAVTIVGYGVNLLAVPALALAGRWEVAAALIVAERTGKALRTPARDAMLAHATHELGRGWAFGLHEALDQVGAMLGPLVVAAVLALRGDLRSAFAVLLAPAVLALGVLLAARRLYPRPRDLAVQPPELAAAGFSRRFWLYLGAIGLMALGYADFPLLAYHFERAGTMPAAWVPLAYGLAMGVDALAALAFGRLFDRLGVRVLALVALVVWLFAPLAFLGSSLALALLGVMLWGVGMGAQESVMRAAVAGLVPADRRGAGYGLLNAAYGLLWFLGSAIMGALYDRLVVLVAAFSAATLLAAVPLFLAAGAARR